MGLYDAEIAKKSKALTELWVQYHLAMREGTKLQESAWTYMNEAESASDGYVEMRKDFRGRTGPDGFGDATKDYKFSQYSEAQKAGKDNVWYTGRATMMAGMATMSFTRAQTVMAHIQVTEQQIAYLKAKN